MSKLMTDRGSSCCGANVIDHSGEGKEGVCSECHEHCGYEPLFEPTFYVPTITTTPKRGKYNQTIDIVERGLDGECGEDQNGIKSGEGHQRLLIPQQQGQKPYIYCLKCGEFSHL